MGSTREAHHCPLREGLSLWDQDSEASPRALHTTKVLPTTPCGEFLPHTTHLAGSASTQSDSGLAAREQRGLIQPGKERNLVELRAVPSLLSSRGEKKAGSMLTQSISPCLIAENNRAGKLVEEIHMLRANPRLPTGVSSLRRARATFQPLSRWPICI